MSAVPARAAAPLVALALLASACSGSGGGSPQERLASARTALDETSGLRITMAADPLPEGVSGLVRAEGVATDDPAFEGTIRVTGSGLTANVDVVAVDGDVHARLPFRDDFVVIDPADYGAPDPADLMSAEDGLSSLLTAAEDVTEGDQVRDGDAVLTEITGSLPGDEVAALVPSADPDGTFDATFRLDGEDRLTGVRLTGPFYPGADETSYDVRLADYGTEKQIVAP